MIKIESYLKKRDNGKMLIFIGIYKAQRNSIIPKIQATCRRKKWTKLTQSWSRISSPKISTSKRSDSRRNRYVHKRHWKFPNFTHSPLLLWHFWFTYRTRNRVFEPQIQKSDFFLILRDFIYLDLGLWVPTYLASCLLTFPRLHIRRFANILLDDSNSYLQI